MKWRTGIFAKNRFVPRFEAAPGTMTHHTLLLSVLWAFPAPQVFATDAIVTLDTGRQIRGCISPDESTADFLTVRNERAGAILLWRGRWDRIRSVTFDGKDLRIGELRQQLRPRITRPEVNSGPDSASIPSTHEGNSVRTPNTVTWHIPIDPNPALQFASAIPTFADDGLCGRGIVVGVRDDPLAAYPDLEAIHYASGIPVSERAFARNLFRDAKAIGVYGTPSFVGPVPLPTSNDDATIWIEAMPKRIGHPARPHIEGRSAAPESAIKPSVIHDSVHRGWMQRQPHPRLP
jgi:hypothetical protein